MTLAIESATPVVELLEADPITLAEAPVRNPHHGLYGLSRLGQVLVWLRAPAYVLGIRSAAVADMLGVLLAVALPVFLALLLGPL